MVVSEMEPFAKTGGLADVAGALPKALSKLGAQVHVFMPRYACVKEKKESVVLQERVTVHFVDHETLRRPGLYGDSRGDYPDNLKRFSLFCRGALESMKKTRLAPDILHAHDWQAALSVVYLKKLYPEDPSFKKTSTVLTIHNLGYQGIFPKDQFPWTGLPWDLFGVDGLEFYNQVNCLKGGLLFSQRLATVSPAYSREIQTPEQGHGLEGVLRMRREDLVGILNGIDEKIWDPSTDSKIPSRYSAQKLSLKSRNKAALQKRMKLRVNPKTFLIGLVTRLASQKGLDLVSGVLPALEGLKIQLVILGSGDHAIEQELLRQAERFPWMRLTLGFHDDLAHQIYAGADAFLMPSRYEPCGLGQMIAMRYGTVPLVRSTGGLTDTVKETNGFSFTAYTSQALMEVVRKALAVYQKEPSRWKQLQRRGMTADFSWERSAKEYLQVYEKVHASRSLS